MACMLPFQYAWNFRFLFFKHVVFIRLDNDGIWEEFMQHVFIVGAKGIPGAYGGYETFVDRLTERHQGNPRLKYHVACKGEEFGEFEYHNARCFKVKVPDIGAAQAIYYDVMAIKCCLSYILQNRIPHPIIYVLACRIGPFAAYFQRVIRKLGGRIYINPDGHEWKRGKWPWIVRRYWKISEQMMVKNADMVVCDSRCIEAYIKDVYRKYAPETKFIAYGADVKQSRLNDNAPELLAWYADKGLEAQSYYLIVGRFVPENNFEIMIKEYMKSKIEKKLVIISTANGKFLAKLESALHFRSDKRIIFAGTVYNQELIKKIRENAYGYIHGHEVGGTNPSLLEALASTNLNLLLNVGFNREVGQEAALYWDKKEGSLAALIELADKMGQSEIAAIGFRAKKRIAEMYSWEKIADSYEQIFRDEII